MRLQMASPTDSLSHTSLHTFKNTLFHTYICVYTRLQLVWGGSSSPHFLSPSFSQLPTPLTPPSPAPPLYNFLLLRSQAG